jgi:hypothetical protein
MLKCGISFCSAHRPRQRMHARTHTNTQTNIEAIYSHLYSSRIFVKNYLLKISNVHTLYELTSELWAEPPRWLGKTDSVSDRKMNYFISPWHTLKLFASNCVTCAPSPATSFAVIFVVRLQIRASLLPWKWGLRSLHWCTTWQTTLLTKYDYKDYPTDRDVVSNVTCADVDMGPAETTFGVRVLNTL